MIIIIEDSKGEKVCQFAATIHDHYYDMDLEPINKLRTILRKLRRIGKTNT